jgi:hypothetical protein
MTKRTDVLLVGSLPLRPASAVFERVARCLGSLAARIPDGEQIGWVLAARKALEASPALEVSERLKHNGRESLDVPFYRLKPGKTAKDLQLGPYGYAANAITSYAQFKKLRDAGVVSAGTRLQVTMPGPGTSVFYVQLPPDELLPLARQALLHEIEQIVKAIPPTEIAIQLDVAMEAEHEEWLRRPDAFDTPVHKGFHWTQDQMADSVAWLADRIPTEVELGFHICSIWHHYQDAGQDNSVLVDTANAIARRTSRPIAYFHIPVIPEHEQKDYEMLRNLQLDARTRLYIGLLNAGDGIEGAKKRIDMARKAVSDFGIAWYCGLGRAIETPGFQAALRPHVIPTLRRASADTLESILELHKQAAEYAGAQQVNT